VLPYSSDKSLCKFRVNFTCVMYSLLFLDMSNFLSYSLQLWTKNEVES
jgi:hypothetical protein